MQKYEIQIGKEWYPVRGYVNAKGWLEWKDSDGAQGLKQPGTFRPPRSSRGEGAGVDSQVLPRRKLMIATRPIKA